MARLKSPAPHGLTLKEGLRRSAFWTLIASGVFANLGWGALFVHQVAYMVWKGQGPLMAATVVGVLGLTSRPGRLLFNLLGDSLGSQRVLALTQACQGAGMIVLLLAPSTPWFFAYAIVYGVALGSGGPLRSATMAEQCGRRAYGVITAAAAVATSTAVGIGPFVAGWLFDVTRSYLLPFGLAAGCAFVAAGLVLLTPPPRSSNAPELAEPTGADKAPGELMPVHPR